MSDQTPDNPTHFHGPVVGSAVGGGTVNAENIAGRDINIHNHPAPVVEKPTFPLHQIAHPPNPNFTGREDILQQVADTLHAGQTTVVTQTIAGLGGIGKTQLALAYSYAHLNDYDLIYWLSADSEPGLAEDLMALARRLKLVPLNVTDQQAAVQALLHWLGQTSQRWLLVYDNADQIASPQLAPYLPRSGNGHVLVTSRNPNYGGLGRVLELGLFSLDEAVAFLFQRRGAKVERGSEAWGRRRNWRRRWGGCRWRWNMRRRMWKVKAAATPDTTSCSGNGKMSCGGGRKGRKWYHATITTTWELAFDEVKKTPGALDLLNLCCFLDPESIPLDLIRQIAKVGSRRASTLREIVADELALDDAVAALRRYSLMQRTDDEINMHRLVQAVARMQMGRAHTQDWAAAAVETIITTLPDWHHLHAWEAGPQILPHMIAAANLGENAGLKTERLAFLDNWSGLYLKFRGEFRTARPYYERALTISEKALGPDHPSTATCLNNLGFLLRAMGDLATARPYLERALAICEKTLGPNHPDTARSLNNLGFLLHDMDNLAAARPYYERALAINEKTLGSDHPHTATSLNNLGALLDSMGDLTAARPYYERALAICENVLGPDHPDTATSLNNLGFLLRAMGDLARARLYYERALAVRENALGPDHLDTANSLNNLAWLAYYEGNFAQSARLIRQTLAIRKKQLGPDHPDTINSRNSLAAIEAKLSP